MTAKLALLLLVGSSIAALSPAHAGDLDSSTNAPSSALPGDPFGDAIPTNKFDPQPVSSPFDRSANSNQQQATGSTGVMSFQPSSPVAQSGPVGALAPVSSRVRNRVGKRLATRIDSQWGGNPEAIPDPRDSYNNPEPTDRMTAIENAFDSSH